jgi:hypothetical protein
VVGLGQTLYNGVFTHFNAIQTQVFTSLYDSDENVLVAAPPGSGKTVCAELALLRLFTANADATAVYIAPIDAIAKVNARCPLELTGVRFAVSVCVCCCWEIGALHGLERKVWGGSRQERRDVDRRNRHGFETAVTSPHCGDNPTALGRPVSSLACP